MRTTKLYFKNNDGTIINKEIEENLVAIYLSMGWTPQSPKKEIVKPEQETEKENKSIFSK